MYALFVDAKKPVLQEHLPFSELHCASRPHFIPSQAFDALQVHVEHEGRK